MMSPSDDATPTWNGDYESPTRKPKPSSCTVLADVVGGALGVGDGTVGDGTLLPLGSVFDIVDLAAGRASYGFVEGPVVTVSVDRGELLRPIRRGDFVRASARVVAVGSSSVTVRVTTAKELLRAGRAPEFTLCFEAQLTFVAINKANGRPYKNVPKLTGVEDGREGEVASVADEVAEVKASIRETAALLGKIDLDPVSALPISAETAETAGLRTSLLSLDDSRVEFRKQYLPRHENFGGNVFGGDLLELLERAALYCGKRFSGAECVSCVRIHGIHFRLPVQPMFLLRSIARVVHVGMYCIEVEVAVHIDRGHEGKPLEASHLGYFSIIPHNANGQSRPVTTGLDLAASSVDAKRAYVKAKLRLERQTFSLQDNAETFEKFLMAS